MDDAFGGVGRKILQICVVINNIGVLIVYMIIIGMFVCVNFDFDFFFLRFVSEKLNFLKATSFPVRRRAEFITPVYWRAGSARSGGPAGSSFLLWRLLGFSLPWLASSALVKCSSNSSLNKRLNLYC